jgi:hypothetical protein
MFPFLLPQLAAKRLLFPSFLLPSRTGTGQMDKSGKNREHTSPELVPLDSCLLLQITLPE